jgi:ABC-type uncharacterized transport system involved in gliding motility auxiliary subunit
MPIQQRANLKLLPFLGMILIIVANVISAIYGSFTLATKILAILGILLFLSLFLRVEASNLKHYLNVSLYVLFVLGIMVIIYLIVANHPVQWDVTKAKYFSLSPQTIKVLKGLTKPIQVVAFTEERQPVQEFLERYTRVTNNVTYEIHNPFREALIAREMDTNVIPGDSFVIHGQKKKKIHGLNEEDFTNAIVEVTREKDTILYFLEGHGEKPLESNYSRSEDQPDTSLSRLKKVLEDRAYKVKTLDLAHKGFVPAECSVLVCVGPINDLFPVEVDAIATYLDSGGNALFCLDPDQSVRNSLTQFAALLNRYGVSIKPDIVVDPNPISQGVYGNAFAPLVTEYGNHPITRDLSYIRSMIIVPFARTVNRAEPVPSNVHVENLLLTSEYSWSEDLSALVQKRDLTVPERSKIHPQCLGVAVTKSTPGSAEGVQTKLVVLGDSDIFSNQLLVSDAPALLFLNSIKWLTAQKDLIAIPPKMFEDTPIYLSAGQARYLFVLLVVLIPSLVFFGGLSYTVMRRRMR